MLLAFEAVQAANRQSPRASEQLDRALRRAFWQHSRPIHLHHEILDIAAATDGVDPDQLDGHLRTGSARADVFADFELSASPAIAMSPHVFLRDGTDHPNPGIAVHWHGNWAHGFPVIDHDDPTIGEALLTQAVRQ